MVCAQVEATTTASHSHSWQDPGRQLQAQRQQFHAAVHAVRLWHCGSAPDAAGGMRTGDNKHGYVPWQRPPVLVMYPDALAACQLGSTLHKTLPGLHATDEGFHLGLRMGRQSL